MTIKSLPEIHEAADEIERLSRNCFYKIHIRKLHLDKIQSWRKMAIHMC